MRTEDKVMNNGKLQAKQETLKSLHCPSPQSSLFSSQGSSLISRLSSLISSFPAPNPDQSAKSLSFCPQDSIEAATHCPQHNSKSMALSPQHNDESVANCPQQLFIDMSTELLRQGKNVRFRAPGLSMHPTIKEGETIIVIPISSFDIKRGDILLYIVGRKIIAHRVVGIEKKKSDSSNQPSTQYPAQPPTQSSKLSSRLFLLRGDASSTYDEPVQAQQVLGKVVSVERQGRKIDLYSRKARMLHVAYTRASRLKRLILCLLRKWDQIFIFNKKHWGDLL